LRPSSSDIADLVAHTHIYYTGSQRDAREVLHDQNSAMQQKEGVDHARVADSLHRIKDLGYRILDAIEHSNFDKWGRLLDEHWQNKKKMSSKISLQKVDQIYDEARARFGVLGGKIIGAGGGGFLMLYSPNRDAKLEQFMEQQGMPRMHYTVEPEGTKVVAQMGHGFLSATQSMAIQESA
jgi:D-glycero-alpha-D-manno-heptose-7-phosphate kinase